MLRPATAADLPRLLEIRDSVGEKRFTDPAAVTEAAALHFIATAELFVWREPDGPVAGFAVGDRRDGSVWALFVAPGHEGKGIGRALLKAACDSLREAGHRTATVSIEAGTRAERHYRADGWSAVDRNEKGEIIFQKPL